MKYGKGAEDSARAKHTEKITEILPRFVSSLGQGKAYQTQLLIYHWEKIVGSSIAGHVRPVRMDFRTLFLAADAEPDFPWQIDVTYFQETAVDVVVDRLLAAHQLILVRDIDLMDRMPLLYKRRYDPVQSGDLILTCGKALARLRNDLVSLQMGFLCIIKGLEQRGLIKGGADITDVRWMQPGDTHLLNKVRTMLITAAEPAESSISAFPRTLFAAQ